MKENPLEEFKIGDNTAENYEHFDLHRPFVDEIFLVSDSGKKMIRETDLIDGWFDSGAMPYAQVIILLRTKRIYTDLFPEIMLQKVLTRQEDGFSHFMLCNNDI